MMRLYGTKMTKAGLAELRQACPDVHSEPRIP